MQVDELARSLMPANLEALRGILHATAVEVLLWFGSWAGCELKFAVATYNMQLVCRRFTFN